MRDQENISCRDWLHEYEQGVKQSLGEAAARMLHEQGALTGDPMGDCKKIQEGALVLQYS